MGQDINVTYNTTHSTTKAKENTETNVGDDFSKRYCCGKEALYTVFKS